MFSLMGWVKTYTGLASLPSGWYRVIVAIIQPWVTENEGKNMRHLVGKPTMWFPNRSDTNQAVQAQKRARSLKFRI